MLKAGKSASIDFKKKPAKEIVKEEKKNTAKDGQKGTHFENLGKPFKEFEKDEVKKVKVT